jgi:hypothetical protein
LLGLREIILVVLDHPSQRQHVVLYSKVLARSTSARAHHQPHHPVPQDRQSPMLVVGEAKSARGIVAWFGHGTDLVSKSSNPFARRLPPRIRL